VCAAVLEPLPLLMLARLLICSVHNAPLHVNSSWLAWRPGRVRQVPLLSTPFWRGLRFPRSEARGSIHFARRDYDLGYRADRHAKRGAHACALGAWLHGMGSNPERAEALFPFEFFIVDGFLTRCVLLPLDRLNAHVRDRWPVECGTSHPILRTLA